MPEPKTRSVSTVRKDTIVATKPELPSSPLDHDQEARVSALKVARQVLGSGGPFSSGPVTPTDLIQVSEYILQGWPGTDTKKEEPDG